MERQSNICSQTTSFAQTKPQTNSKA